MGSDWGLLFEEHFDALFRDTSGIRVEFAWDFGSNGFEPVSFFPSFGESTGIVLLRRKFPLWKAEKLVVFLRSPQDVGGMARGEHRKSAVIFSPIGIG